MPFCRARHPQFCPGDKVVSLVFHPPEIKSGTAATIVEPHTGVLYAVKLPDGELHRWFADFELERIRSKHKCPLEIGDLAKVTNTYGHHSMIYEGMVVQIAKVITQTPFYDLKLVDGQYHRWLAEFEITHPL